MAEAGKEAPETETGLFFRFHEDHEVLLPPPSLSSTDAEPLPDTYPVAHADADSPRVFLCPETVPMVMKEALGWGSVPALDNQPHPLVFNKIDGELIEPKPSNSQQ